MHIFSTPNRPTGACVFWQRFFHTSCCRRQTFKGPNDSPWSFLQIWSVTAQKHNPFIYFFVFYQKMILLTRPQNVGAKFSIFFNSWWSGIRKKKTKKIHMNCTCVSYRNQDLFQRNKKVAPRNEGFINHTMQVMHLYTQNLNSIR